MQVAIVRPEGCHVWHSPYNRYAIFRYRSKGNTTFQFSSVFYQTRKHLIDTIDRALGLPILWSVPTVVVQGSHTGFFNSSIQSREKTGWLKQMEWTL